MKTINVILLIFLIFGSLISITLSSRLRKFNRDYDESFLEEVEAEGDGEGEGENEFKADVEGGSVEEVEENISYGLSTGSIVG